MQDEGEDLPPNTPPAQHVESTTVHSPRRLSALSGTTARSSLSAADAAELDPEIMLENLSPLYSAAENILEIVAPVNASKGDLRSIIKQIRASTSRTAKRFAIKQKAIEPYIDAFDSRNMIRRDVVLKAFFHPTTAQDLDSHPWRPDVILYKANLAIMAKQLLSLDRDDTGSWDCVRELDDSFPLQFLSTFPASETDTAIGFVGGSRLLKETFTFALELRTQLAIILLSEKYEALSRSPYDAVTQLFGAAAAGEDSAPVDIVEGSQIRGWGIEALCESKDQIPRNFTRQVTQRVNEIKSYFTGDVEYTVDYEGLSERFPWREFMAQALEWTRLRNMEIEEQLEHAGGVERLSFLLSQELQSGQKPRTSLGGASTATAVSTSGQSPRRSRNSRVSPDGQFEEAGDLEVAEDSRYYLHVSAIVATVLTETVADPRTIPQVVFPLSKNERLV